MRREVLVPKSPQRIISLVPSQTELLYDLGLGERVVGITKFCIYPESWRSDKTIVGGTKQFRFEQIDALQPDLIIGNKEENYKEGIEQLAEQYPVWMSDVFDVEDAQDMITAVSQLCEVEQEGRGMVSEIRKGLNAIEPSNLGRAIYLIWRKPYMAVGPGTFIDQVLRMAGFENLVTLERYPELTEGQLQMLNPDHILLSSEPFPFGQKHIQELKAIVPKADVRLVDGELFSWYGSRLLKLPAYLNWLRNDIKG